MTARNENRPGYKKTKIGWIPEEWEAPFLGSVAQFRNGLNFLKGHAGFKCRIIGVSGFQDYFRPHSDSFEEVELASPLAEEDLLAENDLLFVRSNGNKDLIGRCLFIAPLHGNVSFSGFTIRARIRGKHVLPLYIAIFFRTRMARREILAFGGGTNISNLNQSILESIRFPLPPLPEQERIAEVLGAWDRAIGLTDRLIEAKQRLKKGLMQQLLTGRLRFPQFGKPARKHGELPKGWKMKPISGVAQVSFSGVDKKRHPDETPVQLCNYMDVYGNDYITPDLDFMQATASVSEIDSFTLHKGDVLITKDSETPDDIGVPAVVTEDLKGVVCGYHLALLRPNPEKADPVFLAKELGSSRSRRHFSTHANGATRFGLSNGAVKKAQIHLPPIDEQKALAAALYACDREIQLLIRKCDCLQQQKRGLMQKLLTGEVRVPVKGRKHNVS